MTRDDRPPEPEAVVSAYADAEVSAAQAAWVDDAVGTDSSLAAVLDDTLALKSLLGGLAEPRASDDDWRRIGDAVSAAVTRETRRIRVVRAVGAAAAVVALCAVALGAALALQGGPAARQGSEIALAPTTRLPRTTTTAATFPTPASATPSGAAGAVSLPAVFGALVQTGGGSAKVASSTTSTTSTTTRPPAQTVAPGR